jgi:hypothetical protein
MKQEKKAQRRWGSEATFEVLVGIDHPGTVEYWLTRPMTERFEAMRELRKKWYGDKVIGRLPRVLEVATGP